MRILHTSDWHLGQSFYGKSRANEHQQFLHWLLEQVEENNVDIVIVAGDIFDTGTPPSYAREMYFDFIVQIQKLNCQLVVLAGNHDSVAMMSEAKQLLTHLNTHVITTANTLSDDQLLLLNNKDKSEQCVVCAIPFVRPRDVTTSKAGQSAREKQRDLQQAISDHYQYLYEKALAMTKSPVPVVMTGHLTTVGASTTDSVRDIYIGTLDAFPANAFPPADYIALGHIHQLQQVAKSDHIRYCGSPIPLSFDEAKRAKSILLVELNSDTSTDNEYKTKLAVTPLEVPVFQRLAMLKTEVDTLEHDIENLLETLNLQANEILWLDIEIQSSGYLQDVQSRIENIVQDLPIDVLLVRRSKQTRQLLAESQQHETLNELSVDDVFESRLQQETWPTQEDEQRKTRLATLFKSFVEKVTLDKNPEDEEKQEIQSGGEKSEHSI